MTTKTKIIDDLTEFFNSFPGIGKKTALRFTIQLLQQDEDFIKAFGKTIQELPDKITSCKKCCNISDAEICEICTNVTRNQETICVVQDLRDVIAIENTKQFNGLYHVLGGVISPMDGIGPNQLNVEELMDRLGDDSQVREIILALPSTMEGDTTSFYIFKKLQQFSLSVSTIARGISFGDQIEYADELTLGKSILNRIPYETGSN